MQIKEVMSGDIEIVSANASIKEAAQMMRKFNIGAMPVRNGKDISGIVTDRDLAVRAVAEGKDPGRTMVKEVMTPSVIHCYDDEDIEEAAKLMRMRHVHRIVVFNHDENPVGILSMGDLAVRGHDEVLAGRTLGEVSQPYQHHHQ